MVENLQKFLIKSIPITCDMGLKLTHFEGNFLQAKAPLNLNINDKGSVFGGSSSALMIITAWSLIKLKCQQFGIQADIVIHKNDTVWHQALYKDLIINAELKLDYDFNKIRSIITDNRHQRIECKIELVDDEAQIFSTMNASYVIISKKRLN